MGLNRAGVWLTTEKVHRDGNFAAEHGLSPDGTHRRPGPWPGLCPCSSLLNGHPVPIGLGTAQNHEWAIHRGMGTFMSGRPCPTYPCRPPRIWIHAQRAGLRRAPGTGASSPRAASSKETWISWSCHHGIAGLDQRSPHGSAASAFGLCGPALLMVSCRSGWPSPPSAAGPSDQRVLRGAAVAGCTPRWWALPWTSGGRSGPHLLQMPNIVRCRIWIRLGLRITAYRHVLRRIGWIKEGDLTLS